MYRIRLTLPARPWLLGFCVKVSKGAGRQDRTTDAVFVPVVFFFFAVAQPSLLR